ncbi:hypothetical protein ACFL59_00495, partial [Planctomycetota bacterium]
MGQRFAVEDLGWALVLACWLAASRVSPVIEEESQEVEIAGPDETTQEEVDAQPAVEILDHRARPYDHTRRGVDSALDRRVSSAEAPPEGLVLGPVTGIGGSVTAEFEDPANIDEWDVVLLRDVGQARVDFFGEGEKLVSLILQSDADRSNTVRGMGLERSQLGND